MLEKTRILALILYALHGCECISVFQVDFFFSFQKTSFKVNRKDIDIIMYVTNVIADRVFKWN